VTRHERRVGRETLRPEGQEPGSQGGRDRADPTDERDSEGGAERRPGASRPRYPAVFDSLPAAVYATDAEGRITFFNEAAAALWGRRPVVGKDRWCGSWRLFWPDGRPISPPSSICSTTCARRA